MKKILLIISTILCATCTELSDVPPSNFTFGGGALVLNEGNFSAGNGSLSFYSYDSLKIYNDLFSLSNGRPLGDVPNSIIIYQAKAYIVVNNSGKIEVIDNNTFKSTGTITGLDSPRNMAIINDGKAYVTSLYSDSLAIVDLYSNSVSGHIGLGRSSEAIILAGNLVYVSNWMQGNQIMVVNTLDNKVVDSIEVGIEPESMVIDRDYRLWVLCNGGWQRENFAELNVINTITNNVEKKYVFPSLQDSPSCLKIDGFGQNLFFINKGVRQMDIYATSLPAYSLVVPEAGSNFNKIAINPVNSDILISDALDYMQNGYLHVYKNNGGFVSKHRTGIIPGAINFRITTK